MILGDELAAGDVELRDLGAASQKPVPLADLAALLRRKAPGGEPRVGHFGRILGIGIVDTGDHFQQGVWH